MKATAIAHSIQGPVKYHGLKKPKQRIPFHDSTSVCANALHTATTVDIDSSLKENIIVINEILVTGQDKKRVEVVLDKLKSLAEYLGFYKVVSRNSVKTEKG